MFSQGLRDFFLQSKNLQVRLISDSDLHVGVRVSVLVCLNMSALWWTDDLSEVDSRLHPVTAGTSTVSSLDQNTRFKYRGFKRRGVLPVEDHTRAFLVIIM